MTPEQWQLVDQFYNDLVDADRAGWDRALAAIEDAEVREEVRGLLDAEAVPPKFTGAIAGVIRDLGGDGKDEPEPPPPPQERFGPWRVTGIIGYGGMGAVYEAVRDDQAFDKKVAIKVLQMGRDSPVARERFQQERTILATLNHPYIAHLIDGGDTTTGISYIVMEYVDGVAVTQWCADHAASRDEILRLFVRICAGVEYAHQHLVVHRDLKPANILVLADGTPKLLDFGIAKLIDTESTLTRTGLQAMTPKYASPEQVMGRQATTATDVYSLGIILYELLTGKAPYDLQSTSSPAAIAQAICEKAPDPPRIAGDLDNILLMALRKEPERRYQSVAAFAADIENYLAHRVVMAREDTLFYRTTRFVQRNQMAMIAAVVIVLTLAAGVVSSQLQARRAQRRFDAVRGLASEVLFRVDARLSEIPATTEARQELVRTVLSHLEKLAQDTGGDAGLEAELAAAYHRAGSLQASLRGTGDARESLRRAIELGERVRASGSADERSLQVLCQAYYSMGVRSYDAGNTDDARRYLLLAIERTKDPKLGGRAVTLVALASRWLGRMELDSGLVSTSLQWMEEAVVAAEKAVAQGRSLNSVAELITTQLYLARAAVLAGDLKRATDLSRIAAQEATALYEANPGSSIARLAMVEGLLGAGEGYTVPNDIARRIVPLETVAKATAFAERQQAQELKVRNWSTWLFIAYVQQSIATTNDHRAAEKLARLALSTVDQQAIANKEASRIDRRNRGAARIQLAECLRQTGDRVGAVEQATLAIREISDTFSDREAKAAMLRATLILASVYLDGGDRGHAAERFDAARKIAEPLASADPSDLRMAAFLAIAYEGLGNTAASQKSVASEWYGRSVKLWKSWRARGYSGVYDQEQLKRVERSLAAIISASRS
jgi:tetratricopeptide (TPR) repeat protein